MKTFKNFLDYYLILIIWLLICCILVGIGIALLINCHAQEFTAQISKFGVYKDDIQLLNNLPKQLTGVSTLSCGIGGIVVLGVYFLWQWDVD